MSRPPFDSLTMPSPDGNAVARYVERAGSLQAHWEISFPWGLETFRGTGASWGSLTGLYAHMRRRLGEREAADTAGP
jgi:hypothetical protein